LKRRDRSLTGLNKAALRRRGAFLRNPDHVARFLMCRNQPMISGDIGEGRMRGFNRRLPKLDVRLFLPV
jgi:hypothetical protein